MNYSEFLTRRSKLFYLLIYCLYFNTSLAQSLNDISFGTDKDGWAVGQYHILHTNNGGETWEEQSINGQIERDIQACYFFNADSGFITQSGKLYFTADAGLSWIEIDLGDNSSWSKKIDFEDDKTGWMGGAGQLLITEDGGMSWSLLFEAPSGTYIRDFHFVNSLEGWVVGGGKLVMHTIDGGINWNWQSHDTDNAVGVSFWSVYFLNDTTGWILGDRGLFSKYNYIDEHWDFKFSILDGWLADLYFMDENVGFATSVNDIYKTSNGGNTWSKIFSIGGEMFKKFEFLSQKIGFALGTRKSVIKTTDYGITWEEVLDISALTNIEDTPFEDKFALEQNYPNPFNPLTIIKYSLADESKVVLKVYDILGKEIAILENKVQHSGNYTSEFDGTNLPSGIYFYTLTAGNYSETKKMVLIQ